MKESKQIDRFDTELERLITRYRQEYDLTYAAVIGTLMIKIMQLRDEGEDHART